MFTIIGKKKIIGPIVLLSAAMIWGLSFVAQSEGMKYIGGFTFNGIRMILGSLVLVPLIMFRSRKNSKTEKPPVKVSKKTQFFGICFIGVLLCIGSNLQQFAFGYIYPGKVGFLTALYMLLVPLFGLFMKKRLPFNVWIGVVLGMCGLYLLCITSGATVALGKGEILSLLCAFVFAAHLIAIDYFADKIDCVVLSCGQFLITGIISCILMFIFEKPQMSDIMQAAVPIIYAGVFSSGVAFTLQIVGQKYTEPAIASMLLCFESVFSVIFSFLILHTQMSVREYIGCAIMFAAIIIAQVPKKVNEKDKDKKLNITE